MVGTAALKLALNDKRVAQVVALTRRPLEPHPKLLNPIVDSTDLPHDADWWAVDGAICALGTTRAKSRSAAAYRAIDHDYPLAIATELRKRGAARFALVTAMGADARSWFRYPRTKGELENAIDGVGFRSLTIVRPGFLGGERSEHRPLERELGALLRILGPLLPAVARTSSARVVAALLVESALKAAPGKTVIGSAEIARIAESRADAAQPLLQRSLAQSC
jgi:uncharacterized protein YbjT (DUF2867 family)